MTEFWMTGPVDRVPALLTPPAHTFLQVRHEVPPILVELPEDQLWSPVGASASIGFHAVHLIGATDRLLTYARGGQLSDAQMAALRAESSLRLDGRDLATRVEAAMDAALDQLRATPEDSLLETRVIGRKQLPATTLGTIVHAAEHAFRHAGQIVTLARVLSGGR